MASTLKTFVAGCSVAGLMMAPAVWANETEEETNPVIGEEHSQAGEEHGHVADTTGEQELSGPAEDVQESAEVLRQLTEQDPELAQKLSEAKGIFVIPDYATASLLVGGSGGEGVLLTSQEGQWGNPAFYDIGNIDIGAQAGAAAGSIVMLLMNDEALESFRQTDTEFALTAEAGLTIINWSATAPVTSEEGDVVVWSDTEGLLAEASVGVGGISFDEEESREYYTRDVTAEEVLAGNVENPHQDVLQSEFAEFSTDAAPEPQTLPEEGLEQESEWETEYESEGTEEDLIDEQ